MLTRKGCNGELLGSPLCVGCRCCCSVHVLLVQPCAQPRGPFPGSHTSSSLLGSPRGGQSKSLLPRGALPVGPGPIPDTFPFPTQFQPLSPFLSALRARPHLAQILPHSLPIPSPFPSPHPRPSFPRRPLRSHPVADGGTVRPHRAAPLLRGGNRDPLQRSGGPPSGTASPISTALRADL